MRYIPHVRLKLYDKVLLSIIITIFLIFAAGTLFLGSATFVDVLRGYVGMEQFLNGESFNTLNYELSSGKISYFIAWWTPGQYILPYALKGLGMSLGTAQSFLIILFMGVSIIGYMRLFRFFHFSPTTSLLSILLILTNHLFFWNSLMYFGGSLFEVGLFPWFLVFLLRIKTFNVKTGLVYIVVALVLFFLKATFLMHVGIGLGVLLLDFKSRQKSELVTIILTGLSILAVCYFSFLQFGETPSSAVDETTYNSIPNNLWNDIFTPFASIVGIPFAIGTFVQKMLPYFSWIGYVGYGIMLLLSLFSVYLFRKISRISINHQRLVLFSATFLTAFIFFYLMNRAVSYDFRHFAPIAFVFTPFILDELKRYLSNGIFFKGLVYGLIGLNFMFFVFKRMQNSKEINEVSYATNEIAILQNFEDVMNEIPQNSTYLFLNEWNVMPYFVNKHVVPVYQNKNKWFLSSGIELDKAKEVNLAEEIGNEGSCVIFCYLNDYARLSKSINLDKFEEIARSRNSHSIYRPHVFLLRR